MSYGTPPPPPQYGGAPGGAAASGSNSKATWALVTGILSIPCCQILGPVAIVLAQGARKDIAQTGQQGSGLATAGFVLGIIGTVLLVINIILLATGNSYYSNFNN